MKATRGAQGRAKEKGNKRTSQFYHSFPRGRKEDLSHGLDVLSSILRNGLLITAEVRTIKGIPKQPDFKILQERLCFTESTPEQLAAHSDVFGPFALEYDVDVVRTIGALPVFYIPGIIGSPVGLSEAGPALVEKISEMEQLLIRLTTLRHLDGATPEDKAVQERVHCIEKPDSSIEQLRWTARAILNLVYPTDDERYNKPLHYYWQKEWKIIPNFAINDQWDFKPLTAAQKIDLLKSNPEFFGATMHPFLHRRIDYCRCLRNLGGEDVVAKVRRIIVPDAALQSARRLVKAAGYSIKVTPLSSLAAK